MSCKVNSHCVGQVLFFSQPRLTSGFPTFSGGYLKDLYTTYVIYMHLSEVSISFTVSPPFLTFRHPDSPMSVEFGELKEPFLLKLLTKLEGIKNAVIPKLYLYSSQMTVELLNEGSFKHSRAIWFRSQIQNYHIAPPISR